MQNYRSKSETAIIVAGCLKSRRFQFFFAVSVLTVWVLVFFLPFRWIFSLFRWGFSAFQHRQTRAKAEKYKTFSQAAKHVASNNS